MITFHFPFQ